MMVRFIRRERGIGNGCGREESRRLISKETAFGAPAIDHYPQPHHGPAEHGTRPVLSPTPGQRESLFLLGGYVM